VPANSTIRDCPPDDDDDDHDHGGHDDDDDHDPRNTVPHGQFPVTTPVPTQPPATAVIPPAQAQQIEISLRNMADGWRRSGVSAQQIQTYVNTLRAQIYARVQQQLAAAGIHQ